MVHGLGMASACYAKLGQVHQYILHDGCRVAKMSCFVFVLCDWLRLTPQVGSQKMLNLDPIEQSYMMRTIMIKLCNLFLIWSFSFNSVL
jgi:hypothetical protein